MTRQVVHVTYAVKKKCETEFESLLKKHWATLKELALIDENFEPETFVEIDSHGTSYTEVFAWKDSTTSQRAHDLPEVQSVWKAMDSLMEQRSNRPKIAIRNVQVKSLYHAPHLQLTHTFFTNIERTFKAWTSSDALAQWWGPGSTIEARVGGKFSFNMMMNGRMYTHVGEILELESNKRLKFTWAWKGEENEATVATLEFREAAQGNQTEVVLSHDLAASNNACPKGWNSRFEALERYLRPASPLRELGFNCIYAENLDETKSFYSKFFGFEPRFSMPDGSVYGHAGDAFLWIGGGYNKNSVNERTTRTSVMYMVDKACALFHTMKKSGVTLIQNEPVNMKNNQFWFQFVDPAGNIGEVLDTAKEEGK